MPESAHLDVLSAMIDLGGLSVADIGAGSGAFAAKMAARGATVTGVEIDADKVAEAAKAVGPNVTVRQGRGEALPFGDATLDLVTFIFSFHHVPSEVQDKAIDEALRVLRPGGRLHVVEPLPGSALTDILSPLVDETDLYRTSRACLEARLGSGLTLLHQEEYAVPYRYGSFEDVIDDVVGIDPARAARLAEVRDEVERRFAEMAVAGPDGYLFEEPAICFHFAIDAA